MSDAGTEDISSRGSSVASAASPVTGALVSGVLVTSQQT